jgi:hypothetical protein
VLLLAAGCGHTEPFASPPYGSDAPFDPAPPVRLTYNEAADRAPAWLADGSGLLYSSQQLSRDDNDVCLAILPPGGGTQRRLWCNVPGDEPGLNAIESAAPGAGNLVAFLSATGAIGGASPIREAIAITPGLDPRDARMVRTFPYTPAGGTPQNSAEQLRWLDATRLVYLGQRTSVGPLCPQCPVDTVRAGGAVTILDTGQPGSLPFAVPGTANATGVAPEPGGLAVLYTLMGSSRIFRYQLSDGAESVVHDFGAAGTVRDLHISGNRLAAVVGGRVAAGEHPLLGPVQFDSGGVVHVLDLSQGTDVELETGDRLYRRPALAPDGGRLAVEGYPLVIVQVTVDTADTTVSRSGDLYLFGAP